MHDIIDTAVEAGSFKTLATAVTAAGLVDTLKGTGPFTVFGPNNDAFKALPAGTVETLIKPESKAALQDILKYHVVSGKLLAADLTDGQVLTTLNGQKLTVMKKDGKVMLQSETAGNVATVLTADVIQSNGVAHIIDSVLLPKS